MRSILPLVFLPVLFACDDPEQDFMALPVDQAAPHFRNFHGASFDFQPGATLTAPSTLEVSLTNAEPGRTVYILISGTGRGQGDCYPFLGGGGCLDILPPVFVIDQGTFDATGSFDSSVPVPATAPRRRYWMQSVSPGRDSFASEVATTVVR